MGTYQTTISPNTESIEVEVNYSYQPFEPVSKDMEYPGCPEDMVIDSVVHDGQDITKYLHEQTLIELEKEILTFIKNY